MVVQWFRAPIFSHHPPALAGDRPVLLRLDHPRPHRRIVRRGRVAGWVQAQAEIAHHHAGPPSCLGGALAHPAAGASVQRQNHPPAPPSPPSAEINQFPPRSTPPLR